MFSLWRCSDEATSAEMFMGETFVDLSCNAMSDEMQCHFKMLKRLNNSCNLNLYLQECCLNGMHSMHGNKKASSNERKIF